MLALSCFVYCCCVGFLMFCVLMLSWLCHVLCIDVELALSCFFLLMLSWLCHVFCIDVELALSCFVY